MATAVNLHNALFTNNNKEVTQEHEEQPSNEEQQSSSHGRVSLEVVVQRRPDDHNAHLSSLPRSHSTPNLPTTTLNPTRTTIATSEPTRSSLSYHYRSHRIIWTIFRFLLSLLLLAWSIYSTIRYWLSFSRKSYLETIP